VTARGVPVAAATGVDPAGGAVPVARAGVAVAADVPGVVAGATLVASATTAELEALELAESVPRNRSQPERAITSDAPATSMPANFRSKRPTSTSAVILGTRQDAKRAKGRFKASAVPNRFQVRV
jgi:hypothetical protein